MCGKQLPDRDTLPLGRMNHAVANEVSERSFVDMLELAIPAPTEMAAGREHMVRPSLDHAVRFDHVTGRRICDVATGRRHPVALRGDADNFFGVGHESGVRFRYRQRHAFPPPRRDE